MAKPEQLFVGCPFQSRVRKNYDRLKAELEAETPLRVVFPEGHRDGVADTASVTSSDDLLEHITDLIRDSAACLFDATGANPNVSLEVGIAHALPTDFLLTISTRQPHPRKAVRPATDHLRPIPSGIPSPGPEARRSAIPSGMPSPGPEARRSAIPSGMPSPGPEARRSAIPSGIPDGMRSAMRSAIIADLQGRNRIEYKTYRSLKEQLLRRYLSTLPYLKRWHEFEKNHRSYAPLALPVLHEIRASGRSTRPRLDAILSASGLSAAVLLRALTHHRLITVRGGRDGGYFYPSK
jgi:hypothetical protein